MDDKEPDFGSEVMRRVADKLLDCAGTRPKGYESGRLLRDAATTLFDAAAAIEREDNA